MSSVTMEAQRQSAILAHNLNDQVRNLAVEYNATTDTRNDQSNILNKYNQYITLQNKKLEKQLNELNKIESHIATRDSLVRGNQYSVENKNKKIHVMMVFFGIALYLFIVLVAYLGKVIGLPILLTNIIGALIVYSIYVAYVYDLFAIKDLTRFAENEARRMQQDIYDEGRKIEDEINEYINGNCDCPLKPFPGKNGNNDSDNGAKIPTKHHKPGTLPYMDGYFYYDGTAPQEKIYPNVPQLVGSQDFKKENPNKFNIQWEVAPDMGSRDNKRYTPLPTFMSKTVGLPRGNNTDDCITCSKQGKKQLKTDFWTVDL